MDLYQELLANKHLSFNDPVIESIISNVISYEFDGSILIKFKCHLKQQLGINQPGVDMIYGFITDYKLIIFIRKNITDDIYSSRVYYADEIVEHIDYLKYNVDNGSLFGIKYLCNKHAKPYVGDDLTFASLLPVMVKRAK